MFDNFCKLFNVPELKKTNEIDLTMLNDLQKNTKGFLDFFHLFNGKSFGDGLYRIHNLSSIREWNDIIINAFPDFSGRISSFGYDWLGRQFALDKERIINGQPQILMFEPGRGEVYQIPCNFIEFHNEEIPNEHDACLASAFFTEWKSQKNICLTRDECAGYKVMLFLDGEDEVVNLEKNTMDVYWHICSQLLQQLKDVPEGIVINKIEF